jgi:uncharacterized protein (TIGR02646 family)
MFKIEKNEPDFFTKAIKKVKTNSWNDKEIRKIRPKLREYILKTEQNYLCAYCEKIITSDSKHSNIDHFKKKDSQFFPKDIFNYNNLLVSCNTHNRCSEYKDNKKNALLKSDYVNMINSVLENPDEYFEYFTTGEIILKDEENKKAKFTKNIFQLNQSPLVKDRKKLTIVILQLKKDGMTFQEVFNYLREYKSFIKYIYENYEDSGFDS